MAEKFKKIQEMPIKSTIANTAESKNPEKISLNQVKQKSEHVTDHPKVKTLKQEISQPVTSKQIEVPHVQTEDEYQTKYYDENGVEVTDKNLIDSLLKQGNVVDVKSDEAIPKKSK